MNKRLLQQVTDLCQKRGVRLTSQRQQVLELIWQQKGSSSAYDLLDKLKQTEPQAKPPTVYRALEFLLEQGFIHRVESTNSFVSCCFFDEHGSEHKHFSHLLICDQCGDVSELQDDNLVALLTKNIDEHGFTLTNHVIETHGTCKNCRH
ncbi:zinc uptake transcriptional repressor Zur [Vibrio rumoiensis]|uniref:Ferric uptake regulation protein n=1 Tax=Vibrio rumoiensis 1S-45 TaxID=1188252 RepID=A0A1E5E1M5_9VIBR|nr:zinc uptake transcriptional repressor Zur [Vibrio rumoiensis]OEF25178.1 transcriptional repressor [Vibrio rumoiensis 1S-45]